MPIHQLCTLLGNFRLMTLMTKVGTMFLIEKKIYFGFNIDKRKVCVICQKGDV